MATYAVGDIQGCLDDLKTALDTVNFGSHDTLWCVGDLVNRGPDSLGTLRFLKSLGDQCVAVLGNHDLHLLACRYGARKPTKKDTFDEILTAPDGETLMQWLRTKPLLHSDNDLGYTMTHAGIPPIWSLSEAQGYAREVEQAYQSEAPQDFFNNMYGNEPSCWHANLCDYERLRVITNYFTRMRFCTADGALEFDAKDKPNQAPSGYQPWFTVKNHRCENERLLFGHWAALMGQTENPHVIGLDTGCVWGGYLTLLRLEDGKTFCHDCSL